LRLLLVPLVFALSLFVSATLLFIVEPMIGKMVLPSLGGTPAVWNTCMVFFQVQLLAGYAYAHLTAKYLGARRQAALHLGLLAFTLLVLFFVPISEIRGKAPPGDANPVPYLLLYLMIFTGLPFFVASASAPMLQNWFANVGHPSSKDPYFLYAASNLGSMIGLVIYPAWIEPTFKLQDQSNEWRTWFFLMSLLTLGCAVLLWRSSPTPAGRPVSKRKGTEKAPVKTDAIAAGAPRRGAAGGQDVPTLEATAPAPTWAKRCYWVALAAVPSSLMLGATTYITMDVAAIPLLWVIPLALYLLSFIIVFSKLPPWLDKLILIGLLAGIVLFVLSLFPADEASPDPAIRLLRIVLLLLLVPMPLLLWPSIPPLLHKSMVIVLPLLILLLVFMMMSGMKPTLVPLIGLHLMVLFVAAMVCHGELARSRPPAEYLTEFYLLMSVGGVLGGLFNGLVAPLIFTQIAEYPLAMMVACMLLPSLAPDENKTPAAFWTDVILAVAPALLAVGLLFYAVRAGDPDLTPDKIRSVVGDASQRVRFFAFATFGVLAGLAYIFYKKEDRASRALDVAAAAAIGLLQVGLIEGLPASQLRFERLSEFLHVRESVFRRLLIYALPLVLCYTLLARSVRFGLSVGAILLAGSFTDALDSHVLYRDRSFFGVLNVKHLTPNELNDFEPESHQLVHGTTLHGKQFLDPARRREALTYYHKTGPIGQVFDTFNAKDSPKKLNDVALIGLGTGTLTSYGEPGQHLTVYDIDKAVVHIARDTGLFTFFNDALDRGVDLKLVLGDARLRMNEARDGQYDLIAVDAFSSDAIPVHLITKEAMEMFRRKMKPDGIIAFHISNRYLELEPVVVNGATSLGMVAIVRNDRSETAPGKSSSTWCLVANRVEDFGPLRHDLRVVIDDPWDWKLRLSEVPEGKLDLVEFDLPRGAEVADKYIKQSVIEEYRKRLTPDGVVVFRLRGAEADLATGVENLAKTMNLTSAVEEEKLESGTRSWVLFGAKQADLKAVRESTKKGEGVGRRWDLMLKDYERGVWTDDYSNLLSVFSEWNRIKDGFKETWLGKILIALHVMSK
jgi:spermidine synthase